MQTRLINARAQRWRLAAALAFAVHCLTVSVAAGEEDHLVGYRIRDRNSVPATNPVTIDTQFGTQTCILKKAQLFLVESEKNGGDDPRGGPAGHFVCYKAKCTAPVPPSTNVETQFGVHALDAASTSIVCLPNTFLNCGNNTLDPGEVCDGTADAACPGNCRPDCTCAVCPVPLNPFACFAYVVSPSCQACCEADANCAYFCDYARNVEPACSDQASNTFCAGMVNQVGCADECCQ
jgi:hypothetical protein